MRIALIADLHGNMPAIEAVSAHIATQHIDATYCLGDLIGKGPSSAEAFDWAMENCDVVIQGNWDEAVCKGIYLRPETLSFHQAALCEDRLKRLSALPFEHRLTLSGRKIRLIHGRPFVDEALGSDSPIEKRMQLFDTDDGYAPDVVGFADVHRPFYQHMRSGVLFNTGSVGNPLAGQPYASYLILEGTLGDAIAPLLYTIVQLPYDREEAIRQAEATPDMPQREAYINEVQTGRYSR